MSAVDTDDDSEFHWDQTVNELKDGCDPISEALGTPPMVHERATVPAPVHEGVDKNAEEDYRTVRHNLMQIIEDGGSAIEGLLKVAHESESPRAYEVLATYLKNLTDVNKDLMALHETKAKIETEKAKRDGVGTPDSVTNNNVFVGSTEELQAYLEKQK